MGWFTRSPGWQKALDKARQALAAHDDSNAFAEFQTALDACPDDRRAAIRSEQAECAARLFDVNERAARGLVEAKQTSAAIDRYQLALRFATSDGQQQEIRQRLRELEEQLLVREETERAEATQGEDVNVDEFDVFNALTGNLPEDIADQYFDLPDSFRTAVVALHSGNPAQALAALEELASSDGHQEKPVVLFEYGICLRAMGRTDQAIDVLLRAEKGLPQWIAIKLGLAESCWAAKRYELAEEVLQRAIDADGQNLDVLWAIGHTALLTGAADYGLEAIEAALEISPEDSRLRVLEGQLLELAGKEDEAVACFEKVLEATWQYDAMMDAFVFEQDAAILAARVYRRRGEKLDRAEDLYRGLVAITPPRQRWRYELSLGDILVQAGKSLDAQDLLKEVVVRIPESETLARMWAARLMGQEDLLAGLLEGLNEEDRRAWEAHLASHQDIEPPAED